MHGETALTKEPSVICHLASIAIEQTTFKVCSLIFFFQEEEEQCKEKIHDALVCLGVLQRHGVG